MASRKLLLTFLIVVAVAGVIARWATYDRDFPPVSGSRGEYMDMGVNLYNVRSFLLTGYWNVEAVPLLYLCPVYYGLEFLSAKAFGHGFFAFRFWSLFLGTLAILAAALAARRRAGPVAGACAAILLSTDAVWYAFSRCEKQEATAAFFLFMAALLAGDEAKSAMRRMGFAGFFGAMAILTKANFATPLLGMLIVVIGFERRFWRAATPAALGAGAVLAGALGAAFVLHPFLTEGGIEIVRKMMSFYSGAISRPEGVLAAVANVLDTNLYFRSPAFTLGAACAAVVIVDARAAMPLERALAGIVLASLLAPATNEYFPLRYRMGAIPEACLLIVLTGTRMKWEGGWRAGVAAGVPVFLVAGSLFPKFAVPWPVAGAAIMALAAGLFVAKCAIDSVRRIVVTGALVVAVAAGSAQIGDWEVRGHSDISGIAEDISTILPRGSVVATNSWWGRMILLGTDFPEVGIASPNVDAFLFTKEPEGGWSKNETPSIDFAGVHLVYERESWLGTRYLLFQKNGVMLTL